MQALLTPNAYTNRSPNRYVSCVVHVGAVVHIVYPPPNQAGPERIPNSEVSGTSSRRNAVQSGEGLQDLETYSLGRYGTP